LIFLKEFCFMNILQAEHMHSIYNLREMVCHHRKSKIYIIETIKYGGWLDSIFHQIQEALIFTFLWNFLWDWKCVLLCMVSYNQQLLFISFGIASNDAS
jgi:hypothetical protein